MSRLRTGAAGVAASLAALPGCGGSEGACSERVAFERVGRGAQAATVVRDPCRPPGARPVTLFLHGWGATRPQFYRPWLEHLARRGETVIYPAYQDSVLTPPPQALGNLVAGVRGAFSRFPLRREGMVVVGHSAGGALAADYTALARSAGLPRPSAVLALYPGRSLRGVPAQIPELDPGRIPAATRIEALAGVRDVVVGSQTARAIVRGATRVPPARRRFVLVRESAVADHLGPQRPGPDSRRVFWSRLDRLTAAARRG